jgi:hypothetical protein
VKRKSETTGYGLDADDEIKGITTIDAKLELICPYYQKMDELFGHRQNVLPENVLEANFPDSENSDIENVAPVGDGDIVLNVARRYIVAIVGQNLKSRTLIHAIQK